MITTYGQMPTSLPDGAFKAVHFPILCRLDSKTDYRIIDSAGFGVRDLALTIYAQFQQSYGHNGAFVTGALYEVTVDPEQGIASGRGFLIDTEHGRLHALMIKTQAMKGNSVDLGDVEARWEIDLTSGEETLRFTKANIAATTGVGKPAFADAKAVIDDEITAAFAGDDPMDELVADFEVLAPTMQVQFGDEIVASGNLVQPFDAFHVPEASKPTKIVVTADGRVYGHLGVWGTCHDGIEGRCTIIPRPTDAYASFNKPGVLTDRGIVGTGPIFAYGGHRKSKPGKDLGDAYGGIENAWCDVRITEGIHGPWVSGMVRPGVSEETVYAARASRISGHWLKGGTLKAIVSVNAEGYEVPGDDLIAAGFGFRIEGDEIVELVASFPTCLADEPEAPGMIVLPSGMTLSAEDITALRDAFVDAGGSPAMAEKVFVPSDDDRLLALLLEEDDVD